MRVAKLDMTNSSHQCPGQLVQRNYSNVRTCARGPDTAGCSSVQFPTFHINYTTVCGKVIGYQFGLPEGFLGTDIDQYYLEGVSLTHGSPREHIWSFVAARDEVVQYRDHSCPCVRSDTVNRMNAHISAFVRDDYFCDTGSRNAAQYVFYGNDPLWDGAGCGPLSTCCSFNNPPWFHKQLPQPTSDDIELRVCKDFVASDEDILVTVVELYVR